MGINKSISPNVKSVCVNPCESEQNEYLFEKIKKNNSQKLPCQIGGGNRKSRKNGKKQKSLKNIRSLRGSFFLGNFLDRLGDWDHLEPRSCYAGHAFKQK